MALVLGSLVTQVAAQAPPGTPLAVVASIQPWASLTKAIGGELVEVVTLLPAGASEHAFDPSPSQAVGLANARLVVMNGGLDDWLLRLLDATAYRARRLTIIDEIDFAGVEGHDHGDDEDESGDGQDGGAMEEHGAHGVNPHVWLDPVLAAAGVEVIAEALADVDPENAAAYRDNAAALLLVLAELDGELHELLEPVAGARIVQFHDAWVYFAERYHLDIVATVEPFPGREPSAAHLAATVAQIHAAGVRVIFTEGQLNDRTAVVVAESAGVGLAVLDPLGGAPGPVDYVELLRWNAANILEALRNE